MKTIKQIAADYWPIAVLLFLFWNVCFKWDEITYPLRHLGHKHPAELPPQYHFKTDGHAWKYEDGDKWDSWSTFDSRRICALAAWGKHERLLAEQRKPQFKEVP